MNKHFRFSGSSFSKLEELESRPPQCCVGQDFPRDM